MRKTMIVAIVAVLATGACGNRAAADDSERLVGTWDLYPEQAATEMLDLSWGKAPVQWYFGFAIDETNDGYRIYIVHANGATLSVDGDRSTGNFLVVEIIADPSSDDSPIGTYTFHFLSDDELWIDRTPESLRLFPRFGLDHPYTRRSAPSDT